VFVGVVIVSSTSCRWQLSSRRCPSTNLLRALPIRGMHVMKWLPFGRWWK